MNDRVTLKPGLLAANKVLFLYCNISQRYCFYCIFNKINSASVSRRDKFLKKKKKILDTSFGE